MAISDCSRASLKKEGLFDHHISLVRAISRVIPVRLWTTPACASLIAGLLEGEGVELRVATVDSPWMRDYGPIWLEDSYGRQAIASFQYGESVPASFEANLPLAIAQDLKIGIQPSQVRFEGGNLQADDEGNCFTAMQSYTLLSPAQISKNIVSERAEALRGIGCKQVAILEAIPSTTPHVDMFLRLLSGKVAILADLSTQSDESLRVLMDRNYERISQLGYRIVRMPTPGPRTETYANMLIIDRHAFVPQYGNEAADQVALAVVKELGYEAHGVRMDWFAKLGGAVHCLTSLYRAQ